MIEFKSGDIFQEDAEALVNSVNCVGVMGRGIALQFKNSYPENFKAYAAACRREEVQPGRMFVFETGQLANPHYIINFPTKRHWRAKSRLEDIKTGLADLAREIERRSIRSIAIPPLGSNLGGLQWDVVRPLIEAALGELPNLRISVFVPGSAPADGRPNRSQDAPAMTAGRAALIGLMHRYLGGFLDPFVTLLEVHKLMYFLQAAGEPLRLDYAKGQYGPYAARLGPVLRQMEGHFLSGYQDGGDAPGKELTLIPGAVDEALAFLAQTPETLQRFNRVSELVEGFESSFGLELLATVHWVAKGQPAPQIGEIINRTYAWNHRKRQFTNRQIGIAHRVLQEKGWLEPAA